MFENKKKAKKIVTKLYKKVDTRILNDTFPRGKEEFIFATLMLYKYLTDDEGNLPKLIDFYANVNAMYKEFDGDVLKCLDELKTNDLPDDFNKEVLSIVVAVKAKDPINVDDILNYNLDITNGREIVDDVIRKAAEKAEKLRIVKCLLNENGEEHSEKVIEIYEQMYSIMRTIVDNSLSYRELQTTFHIIKEIFNEIPNTSDAMKKIADMVETVCYGMKFLDDTKKTKLVCVILHATDSQGHVIPNLFSSLENVEAEINDDLYKYRWLFRKGCSFRKKHKKELEEQGFEFTEEVRRYEFVNRETGKHSFSSSATLYAREIGGDGTNDREYFYLPDLDSSDEEEPISEPVSDANESENTIDPEEVAGFVLGAMLEMREQVPDAIDNNISPLIYERERLKWLIMAYLFPAMILMFNEKMGESWLKTLIDNVNSHVLSMAKEANDVEKYFVFSEYSRQAFNDVEIFFESRDASFPELWDILDQEILSPNVSDGEQKLEIMRKVFIDAIIYCCEKVNLKYL